MPDFLGGVNKQNPIFDDDHVASQPLAPPPRRRSSSFAKSNAAHGSSVSLPCTPRLAQAPMTPRTPRTPATAPTTPPGEEPRLRMPNLAPAYHRSCPDLIPEMTEEMERVLEIQCAAAPPLPRRTSKQTVLTEDDKHKLRHLAFVSQ